MPPELEADANDLLTPEELAAINDGRPSDAEIASLKAIADGADDGDDDGDDDGAAPAAAAPAAVPAQAPASAPAPADAAAAPAADISAPAPAPAQSPSAAPAPADPFVPQYVAALPEDFDAKTKDLAAKTGDLAKRFKDGEIDFDQYQAESQALTAERDQLLVQRAKAEISTEMRGQTAQQTWQTAVRGFLGHVATSEGIDYAKDPQRFADLDAFVKVLANNPANDSKPMSWFLEEAHRKVKALHGDVAAPAPPPAPVDAKAAARAAVEQRRPDPTAAPKTLAAVPGSDGPGDVGSEFADIDALEGDELEAAIQRMTPAQREKFARGN